MNTCILGLKEAEKREKFSVKKVKQRPLQAFPNYLSSYLSVKPTLFILVHTKNLNLVKQSSIEMIQNIFP